MDFNVTKRTLGVIVENGTDANDEMTYKTFSFHGVKPGVEKDALVQACLALASLMDAVLYGIGLTEKSESKQN